MVVVLYKIILLVNINTAIGYIALRGNTTGNNNTAVGNQALYQNTTGTGNTAIGYNAGGSNYYW